MIKLKTDISYFLILQEFTQKIIKEIVTKLIPCLTDVINTAFSPVIRDKPFYILFG